MWTHESANLRVCQPAHRVTSILYYISILFTLYTYSLLFSLHVNLCSFPFCFCSFFQRNKQENWTRQRTLNQKCTPLPTNIASYTYLYIMRLHFPYPSIKRYNLIMQYNHQTHLTKTSSHLYTLCHLLIYIYR